MLENELINLNYEIGYCSSFKPMNNSKKKKKKKKQRKKKKKKKKKNQSMHRNQFICF